MCNVSGQTTGRACIGSPQAAAMSGAIKAIASLPVSRRYRWLADQLRS
jgi:hypothetical protein